MIGAFWEILTHSTPEGTFINWLILVLALIGGVSVLVQFVRTTDLHDQLRMAKESLQRSRPRVVHSSSELVAALGWGDAIAAGSTHPAESQGGDLRRYVLDLWALRHMGGSAAQALGELQATREALRLEVPRYLVGILMLVGLMGTVWGLSGIIAGFERAVGAAKAAGDPVSQLVAALSPMKTAFSCTFAGILASVVLGFLTLLQSRYQHSVLTDVEEFLGTEVIPIIFVDRASEELVNVQAMLDKSANLVSQFGEAIGQSQTVFINTLQSAMKAAAAEMVSSVERMQSAGSGLAAAAESLDSYRQTLQADHDLYTKLLVETREATVEMVQKAVAPLERVAQNVQQSLEETKALRQQLADEQDGWRQQLSAALAHVREATGAVSASASAMSGYWDRLRADHEVFAEILEETRNATREMVQTTIVPLTSVTEAVRDGVEETRALKRQLAEEQDGWRGDLAAALSHLNEATDAVHGSAEAMRSEGAGLTTRAEQTIAAVSDTLRAYHSEQLELAAALDELARQLRPELMRTPEGRPLSEAFAKVAQSIEAMAADVVHLAEGTQEVASRTEQLTDVINSRAAADSLERQEQIRELNAVVQRLSEQLHAVEGDGTGAIAQRCAAIESVLREQLALLQKGWVGRFIDGNPFRRRGR